MSLFKFLNKEKRKKKNFMLPEDKEQIIELLKKKITRLKDVQELTKEILLIKHSAKTLIPQFATLHNHLRAGSKFYYSWHLKPYARLTHWFTLFVAILIIFSPFFIGIIPVKAADKVWASGEDFSWSNALNWSPFGAPEAGDTVTFNSTSDMPCLIDNIGTWGANGESLTIIGDEGAVDGFDGLINQAVAIPGMGAFSMTGANSSTQFQNNVALTASSISISGGTFSGAGGVTDTISGNVDLSAGVLNSPAILNIFGNFLQTGGTFNNIEIVGNRTNITGNVDLNGGTFNDPAVLTIVGNFTLAGATYNIAGTIVLSGNWTYTSGAWSPATTGPSVTFNNNSKASTISGSTTFNNFTCITTGKQITFTAGTTQTITTLTLTGGSGDDRIVLRSTSLTGEQWNINPTSASVSYVDVQDSNNTSGTTINAATSFNSGNNTDWAFVINISGTVTDTSGLVLSGVSVNIIKNGALITTVSTDGGGYYEYENMSVTDGDAILTTFAKFGYTGGNTVTIATTTANITADMKDTDVYAQHENSGPVTNSTFSTAKGGLSSSDILYSVSSSNLTLNSAVDFVVIANKTYTPGGNLNADDITIQSGADFQAEANTVTLSGNWSNSGTFTPGASTVNFSNSPGEMVIISKTLDNSSSAFWHLTITNGGIGLFTVQLNTNNLDVNGDFTTVNTGGGAVVLDCNDLAQNYAGSFTLASGTTYTKGKTLTFDGTTAAAYSDSNTTKQNIGTVVVSKTTNSLTLGSSMTVDTMTINANSELELASSGYVLDLKDLFSSALHGDLIGDSLIVGGTLTPGTFSTVKYSSATSTDNVEITTATYNSLQFSGAETYELLGNLTVANALTGSSTIDTGATLDVTTSNFGITLAGNWDNNGTFTPRSGTVTFNAAAGTQTIDNGANDSFWHLTLSNAGIKQLNTNRLDVNGTFSLQGGTFDANGLNQLYAGSVSLSTNTVYTKGGILTFNHATGITYTDSNDTKQNIGTVRLLSAVATPPDNTLTLLSSMTVDTMTITFDNVLALGSSGYILNLAKDGATATVLTVDGTLTPGINSTVKYSALNSGGNINVASTTYDSLQFSGVDEVYVLIDHLTGSNALTGSSTIDTGATLDVTASNFGITLAGNWSNSGTSTPREGTVDFNKSSGTQTLDSGGTGTGKAFNDLTHSGAGTLQLINNHLDMDGSFVNSAGTFDANGKNMNVGGGGGWSSTAIFTHGNNTVTFDYPGASPPNPLLDPGSSPFWNLTIDYTGDGTLTLATSTLDVNGNFRLQDGTFNTNSLSQNYAGDFTLDLGTTYTKGGTLTFDGTAAATYIDSASQNIGTVVISKTTNPLALGSSMTVDTLDIGNGSTINLGNSGYTLDLQGNVSIYAMPLPDDPVVVLRVTGTLNPGNNSTVKYSGVNLIVNIAVAATTYNSLQLSGAETYELIGNLTVANALTGSSTIDVLATLDTSDGNSYGDNFGITLAGNWDNNGTFTSRSGTVTFNAGAGTQTLDSGGTGAGKLFNHLTHSGAGTLQLTNNALDVDGNFYQSAGTFDANSLDQYYAGNFTLDAGTTYTKGGLIAFGGTTTATYIDSNSTKQNIGSAAIHAEPAKILTLGSDMTVDTMIITDVSELELASSGYILNLANNGATATVLTVIGTLDPGTNSTVKYSALNSGGNINVPATTYNSLQFAPQSGLQTYVLTGNLTGVNALTGSSTIDTGATLNASGKNITLPGNWSNSGTFTHGNNTVTFTDAGETTIISGNTTFYSFSCTTSGKTLSFESNSTQTVEGTGTWTITGTSGSHVTLSRDGGSGTDQWFINPTAWSVDYVTVSYSNNLATNPIDPTHYTNGGHTTNWFPDPVVRWCENELRYIPASEWTEIRCVPKPPPPPTKWCELEQKYILESQWTEERCVPSIPYKWCELEQKYILESQWTEERCVPSIPYKWCELEQKYILESQWTEQRCVPPGTKWCEVEQKYIPESQWTEQRCVPPGTKWCEVEQKYIPESEWSEQRCVPPGTKWCEAEQRYIPASEWTEQRCTSPVLKWCKKEQQYIPESEWTEKRCVPPGDRWCEVEQKYIPEEEWTEQRCVPPGTKWCEIEQKYIPEQEWSEQKCLPSTKWCETEEKYILEQDWTKEKCELSLFLKIKKFFESPLGFKITKTISIVGLAFGGAAVASTFLFSPLNWLLLFLRLLSALMIAFGLRKKVRPWGTVYDSVTKQPLDPAYVTLNDLEGKEVASSITDLDGRYGFLIGPGKYKMIAQKTNYKFPSKKLFGKTHDELYNDLYFGEEVEVKETGEVIIKNIPLDQEKFDWNEFAKKKKNLLMFYSHSDLLFRRLSNFLFAFGFIVAIISAMFVPDRFNFIILGLYILLGILISLGLRPRTYGLIFEKETGFPLSFAIVRVFASELEREMFQRVVDKFGRYYILVPKGRYYLKIEKKNEDSSYSHIFTSRIINAQTGIIQQKFIV